jgi:hypothetical protein
MKVTASPQSSKAVETSKPSKLPKTTAPWLLCAYESPVWLVRDSYGKTINIHFDDILPDGTCLTQPANQHWLSTIRRVAFDCRSGSNATIESNANQAAIVKALIQLVSWMILNRRFRFSMLSKADINRYMLASLKGYESCLDTILRMQNALDDIVSEGAELSAISMKDAFARACIPWNRSHKMKATKEAFYKIARGRDTILQRSNLSAENTDDGEEVSLASENTGFTQGVGESVLFTKAKPISLLWTLRKSLEDPLTFEPFPDGLSKFSKMITKEAGHTRTIPVATAFFLAERAVTWVTKIGPKLLELRSALNQLELLPNREWRTDPVTLLLNEFNNSEAGKLLGKPIVLRRNNNEDAVSLRTVLSGFLPTSCYIVIGILTARRDVEISGLETDAITGSSETGWWLKSIIAKTLRKTDYTPCPKLVSQAVDLLNLLREPLTNTASTNKLFVIPVKNGKTKTHVDFDIGRWLNSFARFVKVPQVEHEGKLIDWIFAPHQFRRIFAILFVWRFDYGNLEALSYHLRHFNIRMTLVYVRDAELRKLLGEEYHRLTVEKLKSVEAGDIKPAGIFGKVLSRTISRLRTQVDITDSVDMERKIIRIVENRGLSLKPTVWGYCGASAAPSNIRRSACQSKANLSRRLLEDGTPDPSGSDETTCARCLFHFTDESRLQHWVTLERDLSSKLEKNIYTDLIKTAIKERLHVIRSFIRNSFQFTA